MQRRQEKWGTRIRQCRCLCRQGQDGQALYSGPRRQCGEASRLGAMAVTAGHG